MTITKGNFQKNWIYAFIGYFVVLLVIIVSAYMKIIPTKIAVIPFYDTIGHFILLGVTSYLLHKALGRKVIKNFNCSIPIGPVFVSIFVICEENLQRFSPNRTYDIVDLAANLSGILFFYWLDQVFPPFKEIDFTSVLKRLYIFSKKVLVASLFPVIVFVTLAITKEIRFVYIYRYDFLLLFFIILQIIFVKIKLDSKHDLKIIMLFHMLGLFMEFYKVTFGAWSYPEYALSKVLGVPLYSGFMYGSVAGFLCHLWRKLNITLAKWPRTSVVAFVGVVIYLNFFSMKIPKDLRTFLVLAVLFIFFRSKVEFTNTKVRRSVPLILVFSGLGIFVWIAENIATYLGAWAYPYQLEKWQMVHLSKITSWFLLGVVCFMIVAELLKKRRDTSDIDLTTMQVNK
ncbi:DUF817 family protein [Acetivibrio cellulolyticus]|uniref:DUF817 family protein n=1 Tax=Acetivibrio cellulolyticus TaxID=35830 RepID=UPI0001E2F5D6|nr:DUF817 family protein [Acetivibrio cellulolyticus]